VNIVDGGQIRLGPIVLSVVIQAGLAILVSTGRQELALALGVALGFGCGRVLESGHAALSAALFIKERPRPVTELYFLGIVFASVFPRLSCTLLLLVLGHLSPSIHIHPDYLWITFAFISTRSGTASYFNIKNRPKNLKE